MAFINLVDISEREAMTGIATERENNNGRKSTTSG